MVNHILQLFMLQSRYMHLLYTNSKITSNILFKLLTSILCEKFISMKIYYFFFFLRGK